MFHSQSSNSFYKAAANPRLAVGAIKRTLQGLGARGGINTPKRMSTELQAMMKAKPKSFNLAYPEYAGKSDELAKKLMTEMAPTGTAKQIGQAGRQHKKLVEGLQETRRQVQPGGNPNTAYTPYAPEASPNLTRQVKRQGGTQVPRQTAKPAPKAEAAPRRGQFEAPGLGPEQGATAKAVAAPAVASPAPAGATAKAVGRQTPPPVPYTKQQPISAPAAPQAAAPEIAAAQADAANVGAIADPAEQGLWDQAKGMFMTPEGKVNKMRAGLGIGAGALGGYGLYNAMSPSPGYEQQALNPQYRGY